MWGGLLGAIMAALALGYLAGGALADRRPRPRWVFGLLLSAAAWVAADLLMAGAVLDGAERLGATLGPIVATAVLLGPPMIALGSVSPFVVKLEGQLSSLGVTAGRVFALSTAGSLAGTFVTAFWWIPDYGCRNTLRILLAALVALGVAGLAWPASRASRAALALALAGLPFLVPDPPLVPGSVFAGESPYNTVVIADDGGDRLLCLNDARDGSHSVRLGHGLLTGGYYDVLFLGPQLAQGRRVLVLGMGGGTTVTAYRRLYPGAHVTAVEIDPLVVRVAHEYLGLERGPDLEVRLEDARPFLRRGTDLFDVIEVDVFAGSAYAPFHCLTVEFFEAARARLAPSGLLSMNVYAPGGDTHARRGRRRDPGEGVPDHVRAPGGGGARADRVPGADLARCRAGAPGEPPAARRAPAGRSRDGGRSSRVRAGRGRRPHGRSRPRRSADPPDDRAPGPPSDRASTRVGLGTDARADGAESTCRPGATWRPAESECSALPACTERPTSFALSALALLTGLADGRHGSSSRHPATGRAASGTRRSA